MPSSPRDLNDYIILATASRCNAVLATFDSKLGRIASGLGVEVLLGREE